MTDLRRNLEPRIHRLLEVFPVVMLVGARQTGKTTLSRAVRPDWHYVDLENAGDLPLKNVRTFPGTIQCTAQQRLTGETRLAAWPA